MKNIKHLLRTLSIAALALSTVLTSCEPTTYYTVTFDPNGGTITGESVVSVAEGDRLPAGLHFDLTPPENHWQNGWYRDPEATTEWDWYDDVVTSDITLYAGWKRIYTYTFHGNGGIRHDNYSGNSETWTATYLGIGDRLHIPGNVIRSGHVLEGWYTDEALTDRWDFNTSTVTGDGHLYAKWSPTIDGLALQNYPRVDGATSTRALNMMIACKLLGIPYVWNRMPNADEMSVWALDERGYQDTNLFYGRIATSQTAGAMRNLIEGRADIILRSTTASPDEQAAADAAGVTLIQTPIALDAFVFLKHYNNPVTSLTLDQIRKIYTGQITNWSQAGGANAPIKAFSRPRNSGSEEALRELVMGDLEPADFPGEQQIMSMAGLFWEMEHEPNGIGYIFQNYKEMIVARHEPVFAIEGVIPTPATMKNRTYPLTTEVYAIIRADLDHNSMGYKLYEWLGTDAAKMVLDECGFTYN